MDNCWISTKIKKDTMEKLEMVKKNFLIHYPKYAKIHLSNDFIINEAFDFYLKND